MSGAAILFALGADSVVLSIRPPEGVSPQLERAFQVFCRGLLHDMRARVARVLGTVQCSVNVAHPSGWCNSPRNLGAVDSKQLRLDGRVERRLGLGDLLPNPRVVSESLGVMNKGKLAPRGVNLLMVVFGQFIDHDIVLTPSGQRRRDASFPVVVEGRAQRMPFLRSDVLSLPVCCDQRYGGEEGMVYNAATAFVDASVVYGTELARQGALRLHKDGKLIMKKTKDGWRLPRNSRSELLYTLNNVNRRDDEQLAVAGEMRANENPILTALQTLFAREHNRVCDLLIKELRARGMPMLTDEWLFQQARRVIVAELQSIAFNEFMPAMLGEGAISAYGGYNPKVDPSTDLIFTSAAYRWGHSAIRNEIWARGQDGKQRTYSLQDTFFNPKLFASETVEAWLIGAINAPAMDIDLEHADSVRQFLFSPGRPGRLDLLALNIQRGRDHNLPSYLAARELHGLVRGLNDISEETRNRVLEVYGDPEKIDALIGGLAEEKTNGSLLGPLFHKIVKDQFEKLRNGDRFYYENVRWGGFMGQLEIVSKIMRHEVKLADIIIANSRIKDSDFPSRHGAMRVK